MKKLATILLLFVCTTCFAASLNFRGLFYDAFVQPDSSTIFFLPFDKLDYSDATGIKWSLLKDVYADIAIATEGKFKRGISDSSGTSPDAWQLSPDNLSSFQTIATGDFTLEYWFKTTNLDDNPDSDDTLLTFNAGLASGSYLVKLISYADSSNVQFWAVNASHAGDNFGALTQAYTAGAWYHLAFVRSSGSCKLFINGTEITSTGGTTGLATADFASITSFTIGRATLSGSLSSWTLDEIRLSKTARYSSSFTPSFHGIYQPNTLRLKSSGTIKFRS